MNKSSDEKPKGLVGTVKTIEIDYSQNVGSDKIIFMNKEHLEAYVDTKVNEARIDELTRVTQVDSQLSSADITNYVYDRLKQLKGKDNGDV